MKECYGRLGRMWNRFEMNVDMMEWIRNAITESLIHIKRNSDTHIHSHWTQQQQQRQANKKFQLNRMTKNGRAENGKENKIDMNFGLFRAMEDIAMLICLAFGHNMLSWMWFLCPHSEHKPHTSSYGQKPFKSDIVWKICGKRDVLKWMCMCIVPYMWCRHIL